MKKIFYKISKNIFFDSIKFSDKISLIKAVKVDWVRSLILLNGRHHNNFHAFLNDVKTNYNDYLEPILLLSNQCVHFYNYNKIFSIVSKHGYHFSTKMDTEDIRSKICSEFNLTPLLKQAVIKNTYNIYKVEETVKIYRELRITTIINLCINNPVLVVLEFIDE
tara:strand:- start:215 stop:706 length:492 start_codon:yes stop_codon:yes gene_type:complete